MLLRLREMWFLVFLSVNILFESVNSKAVLVVTAPSVVRLGVKETLLITGYNLYKDVTVSIYAQDWPARKKTFSETKVVISKDIQIKDAEFTVDRQNIPEPRIGFEDEQQYVYIISKCTAIGFTKESLVLVDPTNGHVFIQLDKPIYNPSQNVRIRVIPVDIDLMPSKLPIQLDILTPANVNIDRYKTKWEDKFIEKEFKFPSNPEFGNWTVQVSYGHQLSQKSSVKFEVKDYVLPRFSIKVTTPRFILPNEDEALTLVDVKYVYGEAVKGSVSFSVGILLDGMLHNVIRETDVLSSMGQASITLPMNLARQKIRDHWFPDGGRMYIKAVATEYATGTRETVYDVTCLFVRTPYVFDFKESRRYFKPELRYDLKIHSVYADDRPARNLLISVKATGKRGNQMIPLQSSSTDKQKGVKELSLNEDGRGSFKIDVERDISLIEVMVWSRDPKIGKDEQARGKFEIKPYRSQSGSYIHLFVGNHNIKVGSRVTVTALLNNNQNVSSVTFFVLSRGRITHREHQIKEVGATVTYEFMVASEMVPSIRIVAYFVRNGDVVSDSIHLGVQSACKHELTLSTENNKYNPRDEDVMLKINGEKRSLVGLLAVDKSVYLLSERDVLTRDHFFHTMDKFDLGCGNGGGKDTNMVFEDAGLTVMSNTNVQIPKRNAMECPRPHDRQKRAVMTKRRFTNHTLACCKDGITLSTEKNCGPETFALKNVTKRCRNAFFKCCIRARLASSLGRSDADNVGYDLDFTVEMESEEYLVERSSFPESWLWRTVDIGSNGKCETALEFPSTITEWVIHGISMSPTSGMCISPVHNITVFTNVFVELRLPPIAVRMEQIQIKVVVFNYNSFSMPFSVYLAGVKGICSEARVGGRSPRRVGWVGKRSTQTISYPIMPLDVGTYDIQVRVFMQQGGEVVTRTLRVKAEGILVVKTFSTPLDPHGILETRQEKMVVVKDGIDGITQIKSRAGKQIITVPLSVPDEALKGTESCRITATGNIMGPIVESVINGVQNLIRLPSGCGEQTMKSLAPLVFAYKYLKNTKRVTAAVEQSGNKFMRNGITHQLKHRKGDGSFAVWTSHPSSTWLTAFTMKTFCQASSYIYVDNKLMCGAADWIVKNRQDDDKFTENYHVHHKEMIGGVNGDVSLTAYILVALLECECRTQAVQTGISKASIYLEKNLDNINSPLSLAMITYALAMIDSHRKQEAYDKLLALSRYDEVTNTRYWPVAQRNLDLVKSYWFKKKPSAIEVEITAYALLAQLALGDIKSPAASVKWLIEQRSSTGSFISTQDTVVALQALSEYAIKTYTEDLDMWITITTSIDANFQKKFHLHKDDALVQKSVDKLPIQGHLVIDANGKGIGDLQVELSFNVWNDTLEICQFELDVRSREMPFVVYDNYRKEDEVCEFDLEEGQVMMTVAPTDDYDYGYDSDSDSDYEQDDDYWDNTHEEVARSLNMPNNNVHAKDSGKSRVGLQSRVGVLQKRDTRRQKRQAADGASKSILCIEVCTNSLKVGPTGMSIMEIGLFTGFKAKEEDLKKLKTKYSQLIDRYEEQATAIILYLSEVPVNKTCFRFRALQHEFDVGNIQPAAVRVYEYYEPSQTCMQFYRPDSKSPLLEYQCPTRISCRCMEGRCPPTYSSAFRKKRLTPGQLRQIACFKTDYAFKVKILEQTYVDGERYITIDVKIEEVIKPGIEAIVQEDYIKLNLLKSCKSTQISDNKSYLVMGKDGPTIADADGLQEQKYYLDDNTFLMEYYNKHDLALSNSDRNMGDILEGFTYRFTHGESVCEM